MIQQTPILMAFGANLKKHRNAMGLSQRGLYNVCGIDNGMLSRMENGQVNVTLKTLSVLAETFKIPAWMLLIPATMEPILQPSRPILKSERLLYDTLNHSNEKI